MDISRVKQKISSLAKKYRTNTIDEEEALAQNSDSLNTELQDALTEHEENIFDQLNQ